MNKKIIALLGAAVMVFAPSANAAPFMSTSHLPENSPRENVFSVDGQEFVLLDVTDDKKSKYFVFAKGMFANRSFDSSNSNVFDPTSPASVAYFLNHDFVEYGIQDSFTKREYKLPQCVLDHIDFNHEWLTEEGAWSGEYKVKCGVALLSAAEITKYGSKIGYSDGLDALTTAVGGGNWWLRTSAPNSLEAQRVNSSGRTLGWTPSDPGIMIRPAFWLDSDFFADVAIDLKNAGKNVKAVFKENYSIGELKKIYAAADIYDYLDYTSEVKLSNAVFSGKNGAAYSGEKLDISVNMAARENIDGMLVAAVYRQNASCKKVVSKRVSLLKGAEVSENISLDSVSYESGDYVKLSYVGIGNPLETISNSVRVY